MRGLCSVDRHALRDMWGRVPVEEHPLLRCIMQGATIIASRLSRSSRGRISPVCPSCQRDFEDECHWFWSCPQWSEILQQLLGANHRDMCALLADLQNVSSICAISATDLAFVAAIAAVSLVTHLCVHDCCTPSCKCMGRRWAARLRCAVRSPACVPSLSIVPLVLSVCLCRRIV